jgi:hypothetical protein
MRTVKVVPTVAVVSGTSVTFTFPTSITTPEIGQTFKMADPDNFPPITGTEQVLITVGGTTYTAVTNNGIMVTSQMLKKPYFVDDSFVTGAYLIQFGVQGSANVFFVRRGLRPRRSWADVETTTTTA